jgi:5-methylcytosine-specific restriction protein A
MPEAVLEDVEKDFEKRLSDSQKDSSAVRQERLAKASAFPEVVQVVSRAYRRNADVVAEVLYRAKGKCEGCHSPAPFLRASDGSPYLEVHHRIMLSQGGEDTVENAHALCPNCHRKLHFGKMLL